ncbi:MAG: S8 family serine peptidase [Duncaniella sp.]|nr:S8 family serine peptidase [Duncaniella sp.]
MKLRSIIPILSVVTAITAHAENDYYYYNGQKISLIPDPFCVVNITPINSTPVQQDSEAYKISDARSNIQIYKTPLAPQEIDNDSHFFICYKTQNNQELIPNGYIYIKLKEDSDFHLLSSFADKYNYYIVEQNEFMPLWYTLQMNPESGLSSVAVANQLFESGLFSSCFPSFSFDAREISYDPDVYSQWNLYNPSYEGFDLNVSNAWCYSTGRGIKVAVIDEGIDLTHIDLIDNIDKISYDTERKYNKSQLYGSHGTHCAGIIGATRNNGIHISGVAPDVTLISVSTELVRVPLLESKLADGVNWAWKNEADILSCSWHCKPNDLIKDAILNAVTKGREGKGCIFVKSAGNTTSSDHTISYPGDLCEDVIAVSNIKSNGEISEDSCYGSNILVAAPGTNILSTIPENEIGYKSGTSMACPHVAGVAALILEINPSLSAEKVRAIIARSAKKIGNVSYDVEKKYGSWNEQYGYGMIDAYSAVIYTPRYIY